MYEGVEQISTDKSKDLVTVKGRINVEELPSYLGRKLKKKVELIAVNKDNSEKDLESAAHGGSGVKNEKEATPVGRLGTDGKNKC